MGKYLVYLKSGEVIDTQCDMSCVSDDCKYFSFYVKEGSRQETIVPFDNVNYICFTSEDK